MSLESSRRADAALGQGPGLPARLEGLLDCTSPTQDVSRATFTPPPEMYCQAGPVQRHFGIDQLNDVLSRAGYSPLQLEGRPFATRAVASDAGENTPYIQFTSTINDRTVTHRVPLILPGYTGGANDTVSLRYNGQHIIAVHQASGQVWTLQRNESRITGRITGYEWTRGRP